MAISHPCFNCKSKVCTQRHITYENSMQVFDYVNSLVVVVISTASFGFPLHAVHIHSSIYFFGLIFLGQNLAYDFSILISNINQRDKMDGNLLVFG